MIVLTASSFLSSKKPVGSASPCMAAQPCVRMGLGVQLSTPLGHVAAYAIDVPQNAVAS